MNISKILYKPLKEPLNMHLKITISERTDQKVKYIHKDFDINIVPGKVSFWTGSQRITVYRKPDAINNLPNNDADAFVQQVSTVLNPVSLKLNFNGSPTVIEQQETLWKKWLNTRTNIENSFAGNWVEKALTIIDRKLLPGENLTSNLMQDLFLNEYFRNVYQVNFTENIFRGERTVYGFCPAPIQFGEKWRIKPLPTGCLIKFSGKKAEIHDQPGFNRWLKTKTDDRIEEIRVDGFYQVDAATGWCNAIETRYQLTTGNYEKTLDIFLTTHE